MLEAVGKGLGYGRRGGRERDGRAACGCPEGLSVGDFCGVMREMSAVCLPENSGVETGDDVGLCACVRACVHACMCVCVCVHVCVCVCACMDPCMCVCIDMCVGGMGEGDNDKKLKPK